MSHFSFHTTRYLEGFLCRLFELLVYPLTISPSPALREKGKEEKSFFGGNWSSRHWIRDGTTLHTRSHLENLQVLTLAALWWGQCAAPSPGWPASEPPLEPPAPDEPSQPPRCQPGQERVKSEIVEFVWNALSIYRVGSIYIPQNMVCTYIFKLLECTKVSARNLHDLHFQSISTWQQSFSSYLQLSL